MVAGRRSGTHRCVIGVAQQLLQCSAALCPLRRLGTKKASLKPVIVVADGGSVRTPRPTETRVRRVVRGGRHGPADDRARLISALREFESRSAALRRTLQRREASMRAL